MATKETNNLQFYERLRQVPDYALKPIAAGRLKGMSDINPVFRIKVMTETFGACGVGWKYVITKQWTEVYGQEVKAFCNIELFVKVNGEWSDAIPGTGGSSMVTMESKGAFVSDEAYKMALTDALSVAMKSLGVAADVYYSKDKQGNFETKYETQNYSQQPVAQPTAQPAPQHTAQLQIPKVVFDEINNATSMQVLTSIYYKYPMYQQVAQFTGALTARKDQLAKNGKS